MSECIHAWAVLDKTVLPSPWDQMTATDRNGVDKDDTYFTERYCQQKLVLVVTCPKCGERDTLFETTEAGSR